MNTECLLKNCVLAVRCVSDYYTSIESLNGNRLIGGRPAEYCGRRAEYCGRPAEYCGRPAEYCGRPAEYSAGGHRDLVIIY